mgnify:CR=1 FL=1
MWWILFLLSWNILFSFYSCRQNCAAIRTMYMKRIRNQIWKQCVLLCYKKEFKCWWGALLNTWSLGMMIKLDCCHPSTYIRYTLGIKHLTNVQKIKWETRMLCLGSRQPSPLSLLLFLGSSASAIHRVNHPLHFKIIHTLYERIIYRVIQGTDRNVSLCIRF